MDLYNIMPSSKIIPIFPLDLVLFPNQDLPLRIFEPRYKQMIDDCMLSNKEFGICLAHPNITISNWQAPYNVGTIAKIINCNDIDTNIRNKSYKTNVCNIVITNSLFVIDSIAMSKCSLSF